MNLLTNLNISIFTRQNQKSTLALEQLQSDYEKLKQDEAEKSAKLQELMSVLIKISNIEQDNSPVKEATDNKFVICQNNKASVHSLLLGQLSDVEIEKAKKNNTNHQLRISTDPDMDERWFWRDHSFFPLRFHPLELHMFISLAILWFTHRSPPRIILFH